MKKAIILGAFLCSVFMLSQIGINTPNPQATLDIVAKTTDGSSPEGVLLPRLTGDEIRSANDLYGADQTGTVIFATSATSSLDYGGKTENINGQGYYYFDGTKWLKMKENSWNMEGNSGTDSGVHFVGTTDQQDLIFKRNDFVSGIIGSNITSFGYQSMKQDVDPGSQNVAFGHGVLRSLTTGLFNTGVGSGVLHNNTKGSSNVAIGNSALMRNTEGNSNIALGGAAMVSNTTGGFNIGIGETSLWSNTTGVYNIGLGWNALKENISGYNNVAIGISAGSKSTGDMNIFIGPSAGSNITGSGNTIIGFSAGNSTTGETKELNNRLIIASGGVNVPPLIDGDFWAQSLKVNGTFEINKQTGNGAIKIVDGTQGIGKVLTSDADGTGTWKNPSPFKMLIADYTITGDDHNAVLLADSTAEIAVIVPQGLPSGFSCKIIQNGPGQVKVTAPDVTLNSSQGLKSRMQYSVIEVIVIDHTRAIVTGDTII